MNIFLFIIVFIEMALISTLSFETPIRKLVVRAIDPLKQGRGPLVAKSVGATIVAVLGAHLYDVFSIDKRKVDAGKASPSDEILMNERLLEATLMGFGLFLVIIMNKLHDSYVKEVNTRKELEYLKRINLRNSSLQNLSLNDGLKKYKEMTRTNSTAAVLKDRGLS